MIENLIGDYAFRRTFQIHICALTQNQRNLVLVRFKACAALIHQIANHHVAILGHHFPARLRHHVLRLRREANQQPVALDASHFGEYIRGRIELENESRRGLLYFLIGNIYDVIIRHRRRFHDDRRRSQMIHHSLPHLKCRFHIDGLSVRGRREINRSGNQNHLRATRQSGLRDRIPHFAAGAIGNVPHRIKRFLRRSGGHQNSFAFQIAPLNQKLLHKIGDLRRFHQPPGAGSSASEFPVAGSKDAVSAGEQHLNIPLRRRMVPHIGIHRRSKDDFPNEGKIERSEKIVGNAVCELADESGSRWRDDERMIIPGDLNMLDGAGEDVFGEQSRDHLSSGKRGEGERLDELLGRLGHHRLHGEAPLLEQARQLGGFVCRDSPANAKYDVHGYS